jgi:hypothetical protein
LALQIHEQEKLLMKHVRIIGLMLLALFSLGAFAASAASAEEGVLPASTFTGTGGAGQLETLNKQKIECKEVSVLEGKFVANDKEGTANLHFTKCKAEGFLPVNSLGDASEVILAKVKFTVCLVNSATLTFGMAITPSETVHIEVPSLAQLLLVKGTVIAELEGAGLKGKEFKFKLAGKEGDQTAALKCEVEGKKFAHTYESANDKEAKDEHASENAKFTIKFTEEVQLEDK